MPPRLATKFGVKRGGKPAPIAAAGITVVWSSGTNVYNPIFAFTGIVAADTIDAQVDDDPAFGSLYGSDSHVVTAGEAGDGQFTFAGIPTLGFGATYYARFRRNGGAWSNVVTKTMDAGTPTHLVAGTGATGAGNDRSQYINTSGSPALVFTCNADVGAACLVRSLDVPPNQSHFEMVCSALAAAGDKLLIGVSDAALALGAAVFSYPGQTGAGCTLRAIGNTTSWVLFANGSTSAVTAPNNLAVGDVLSCETDKATKIVAYKLKHGGTTTLLGTVTLTSNIPANWTATVGADASNGDSGTTNFGGSPVSSANFAIAPTGAFSGW